MKKYKKAYIEITNVCNLNCAFCPKTKRATDFITLDKFTHVINEVAKQTDYVYFHVLGEPTLHKDIAKFVELANMQKLKVTVTTNGTMIAKLHENVNIHPLYKANISLQALGGNDNMDIADYITKVSSYAKDATANGTIIVLRLWNEGSNFNRNNEILKELAKHYGDFEFKKVGSTKLADRTYIEGAEEFTWKDTTPTDELFCYGLRDQFAILVDGTVIPCCIDSEGEIPLGNIYANPLENILSGEKATALYDGFSKRKAVFERCKLCGYAKRFSIK